MLSCCSRPSWTLSGAPLRANAASLWCLLCRALEEAAAAQELEARVRAELAEGRAAADAAAERAATAQEEARSALARAEERGRALDARAAELVPQHLKPVLISAL